MASPQKSAPKPTSRWGFLTQAVASVESRLDTILGDEDVPPRKPTPQPAAPKENVPLPRASTEIPPVTATANDRLQERLARAMAKKNLPKIDSPAVSEPVSRSSTPGLLPPADIVPSVLGRTSNSDERDTTSHVGDTEERQKTSTDVTRSSEERAVDAQVASVRSSLQRPSNDEQRRVDIIPATRASDDEVDAMLLQVQLQHEDTKSKMQDEIQGYIERIDALNAKLQYLTKETADSAKQSAANAEPNSLEKKLSECDERIALLMQEGQKLSMTEMKHLATIKKLRTEMHTSNKNQDAVRLRAERAEQKANTLDERVRKAEASARVVEVKLQDATKKARDLEAVRRERNSLVETLSEMKAQVAKANARAEGAESKVNADQFDIEKRRVMELQDDLSSAKAERELAEGKLRQEIKELKASLDKEKEHTRLLENEMLAEQASLESKLESLRVRAEEASANDRGDAQAKLFRQIETLQSQYATASQNWQGIEGTLLARITALEKEREEMSGREVEVRRKLKDATSRAKASEKDLEDVQLQFATFQETHVEDQLESQRSQRRIQQLEEKLSQAQKEMEEQKIRLERDFTRRLDEERTRWAASVQLARAESIAASTRKTSAYDINHLTSPQLERPASRRSSTLASAFSNMDLHQAYRQNSTTSSRHMNNGTLPETPILVTSMDPDDEYFAGVSTTPVSPDHAPSRRGTGAGIGDVISTSTAAAGPSVQLVERMSANVRRLESEKAASKDELARLTTQRDESRDEVVRLMREVEQKRKFEQRLKELETEHSSLSERYQTTLELLGEKSEQVDELKADILDVKQMYRQLADHMK